MWTLGLSALEAAGVAALRVAVPQLASSSCDGDQNLVRWLEDSHWKIDVAAAKLVPHLQMRAATDLANVPDDKDRDPVFIDYYSGSLPCVTGAGNFVYLYVLHGKMDVNAIPNCLMPSQLYLEILRDVERIFQKALQMEKSSGERWACLLVFDFEGYTLDLGSLNTHVSTLFTFMTAHYPGFIRRVAAVNAPLLGKLVVNLLRPLIPGGAKVHVLRSGAELIPDFISAENLPTSLGGSMALETVRVPVARHIPPEFYFQESMCPFFDSLRLQPLTIPAGKVRWLRVEAGGVGARLRWFVRFAPRSSFSFGLYFLGSGSEGEERRQLGIQMPELGFTRFPEYGERIVDVAGVYAIRLSNEAAYFYASKCDFQFTLIDQP